MNRLFTFNNIRAHCRSFLKSVDVNYAIKSVNLWVRYLYFWNPTVISTGLSAKDSRTVAHNHLPPAGDINIWCTCTLSWVQPSAEEVKQDLKKQRQTPFPNPTTHSQHNHLPPQWFKPKRTLKPLYATLGACKWQSGFPELGPQKRRCLPLLLLTSILAVWDFTAVTEPSLWCVLRYYTGC